MSAHESSNPRTHALAERLDDRLVDETGAPVPVEVVEQVVARHLQDFEQARLQEFVGLLAEKQAREELRDRGMRHDWSDVEDV
jgi:hypothetical protein